jgi:hypothetical protein
MTGGGAKTACGELRLDAQGTQSPLQTRKNSAEGWPLFFFLRAGSLPDGRDFRPGDHGEAGGIEPDRQSRARGREGKEPSLRRVPGRTSARLRAVDGLRDGGVIRYRSWSRSLPGWF